jgi:uncharacterized membrane protein YkoI
MKRNIVIAIVAAAALVGGGTATAVAIAGEDDGDAQVKQSSVRLPDADDNRDDDQDDRNDDQTDQNDDRNDDATEAGSAKVTAAEAIDAALAEVSGTAVSADLDDDDRNLYWDVDILGKGDTWHSVQIDPGTGKVLGTHTETDDNDASEARKALKSADVTAKEAVEAAADKGTVTSVDLDEDDRTPSWEADTTNGEWTVDLGSGKVTAAPAGDED